ncbi:helix-turn-helix domain-containing protein [Spongiimicrobium sp. 3-5]|uniref:helix-turn-helix domain-containing protein n=1 Tax=Spongiimicrobium sp. 3-5 TaxID=3332596 RepID=UPI0039811E86
MEDLFNITFNFWTAILLFGTLQGIFLMYILLANKQKTTSVYFLTLLIAIVTLNLFNYILIQSNIYHKLPHLVNISLPFLMLIGPAYMFYVKSTLNRYQFKWTGLLHLLPFILAVLFLSPFYFLGTTDKITFLKSLAALPIQILTLETAIFLIAQISLSLAYVAYSVKILKMHQAYNTNKSLSKKYNWLIKLSNGFFIFWLVDFLAIAVYIAYGEIQQEVYYVTMLSCTVFIVLIVLFAIKNNKIFSQVFLNYSDNRYVTSKMSHSDMVKHLNELIEFMDLNKPYLNSELTLQKLSTVVDKPNYVISQVLNVALGKSFYEFVNEYRYKEVKERLIDPQHENLTILAIAFDCGFNNKNTFNRVFKQLSGITPSQFLRQNQMAN